MQSAKPPQITTSPTVPASSSPLFEPLVPLAIKNLVRILNTSNDNKLVANISQDILDRAGQGAKPPSEVRPPVQITQFNVENMLVALKESGE